MRNIVCRLLGHNWAPDGFYQKEDTLNMAFRCPRCQSTYTYTTYLNVDFAINRTLKAVTARMRKHPQGESGTA